MGKTYINLNCLEKNNFLQKSENESREKADSSIFDSDYNKDTENKVKVIAHRGDSDEAPENTIPAYELAAKNGYKYAECDVSWTKDDIPVLLHDDIINRTTGLFTFFDFFDSIFGIKCKQSTYEELLEFDFGSWFDEKYKDTKIPTFEEILKCAKENDLNLYVEIKGNSNFDSSKANRLAYCAKEEDMLDNITWISFDYDNLKKINEVLPKARLGYLIKTEITDETIDELDGLKNQNNEVFADIKHTKVTKDGIEKLKNSGYSFESWTVDDIEEVDYLDEMGCAGYTTNILTKNEIEDVFKK